MTGVDHHYQGPFADGPPATALRVDAPPLTGSALADARRFVVVAAVLGWSVVAALGARLVRRRHTPVVVTACDGLIDGFIHLGPVQSPQGIISLY